jgi:hypothetical protein
MTQSKNIITKFPAPKLDTYRQNRERLSESWDAIMGRSQGGLLALDTAIIIRDEIDQSLASKLPMRYARLAAAKLFNSYPSGKPACPEGYMQAVADELESYPAEVVLEAVRKAIRTVKFLPSVSELVELCDGVVSELRNAKWLAERAIKVHADAECARQKREAVERQRIAKLQHRLAMIEDATGAADIALEALDAAQSMLLHFDCMRYLRIDKAIEAGDEIACRQVASLASLVEVRGIKKPMGRLSEELRQDIAATLDAVRCDE